MKVFITGATGYVGSFITSSLLDRGIEVTILARSQSRNKFPKHALLDVMIGDVLENLDLDLSNFDAIIHLIAIIREKPRQGITFKKLNYESLEKILNLALKSKVKRFIFMSSVKPPLGLLKEYSFYKTKSEKLLKNSNINWTILRPSLIYCKSYYGKSMGWVKYADKFLIKPFLNIINNNHLYNFRPITREAIAKICYKILNNKNYFKKILEGKDFFKKY